MIRRGAPSSRAGFTLLEVLIVMAILALVGGLLAFDVSPWSEHFLLRAQASKVARLLEAGRIEALTKQTTISIEVETVESRLHLRHGRYAVSFNGAVDLKPGTPPGTGPVMLPDGSTTIASLVLTGARRSLRIDGHGHVQKP